MNFSDLDIIKSRTLFLKVGIPSGEVVLSDPAEGDMFFTFTIRYISPEAEAKTILKSSDQFHADVTVDTRPNAVTETEQPLPVGSYGPDSKPLFLGVVVQPQIANTGQHNVIITFYTGKEGAHGN